MAADLYTDCAPDVETLLVAWLEPLRRTGIERRAGDDLPFTVVTAVAGSESVDESRVEHIVSIHTLCDREAGHTAAAAEAESTHLRMLELARYLDASVDYVEVDEPLSWQPYSDTILRKVARYRIGLTYTTVQPGS